MKALNQIGKSVVFSLYLYSGGVQLRDVILAKLGRARAVVLCYHRIGGCDVLTRPTEEFRRDLDYLKARYECISLLELCQRLQTGKALKRPIAAVTFDDGYRDNYTEAVPALQSAGIPATFFVATGFMGTERDFPHDLCPNGEAHADVPNRYPKLTWDDLRAMQDAGFEIGSHTVNHTDLGRADEATIQRELYDSLATLNQELGERPRAFAFPWGKPRNISAKALEIARQVGYYAVVSAYGGANTRGANPFGIRRVDAGNGYMDQLAWRARLAGLDPDYLRLQFGKFSL